MSESKNKKGYLSAALQCRCPRCREGRLFKNPIRLSLTGNMDMHKACSVCGQPTEIEVGFYYGTGYVSYALTVAITVVTLLIWWAFIGFSTEDNRFFWWMGTNALLLVLLQPLLMRLSRSLWISWFVSHDPDWASHSLKEEDFERLNKVQSGNW